MKEPRYFESMSLYFKHMKLKQKIYIGLLELSDVFNIYFSVFTAFFKILYLIQFDKIKLSKPNYEMNSKRSLLIVALSYRPLKICSAGYISRIFIFSGGGLLVVHIRIQ